MPEFNPCNQQAPSSECDTTAIAECAIAECAIAETGVAGDCDPPAISNLWNCEAD